MLQWIGAILKPLGGDLFFWALFLMYVLLSVFFQYSRKMNAQVEPAEPALRPLTRLGTSLQQKKNTAAEQKKKNYSVLKARRKKTAALLKKTDWLLYDKLKFLPDAHAGQNLNFFLLLFVAVLLIVIAVLCMDGSAFNSLSLIRDTELGANPATAAVLKRNIFSISLILFLPSLSCFLIKKNREFYLDIFALFVLIMVTFYKLVVCTMNGCCPGIEVSWGIYSPALRTNVFPVQITEFIVGTVLSALCVWFMLRSKHYRPGRGASALLLSYAVPRFFWEFLRYHGPTYRFAESQVIFLGFSMTQLICLSLVLVSIVWLFVLPLEKKLMDKLFAFITRRFPWNKQADQANAPEPVPAAKGEGKA